MFIAEHSSVATCVLANFERSACIHVAVDFLNKFQLRASTQRFELGVSYMSVSLLAQLEVKEAYKEHTRYKN